MTKANLRPIIVSMTAIPPRFENLPKKIKSLIDQTVPATSIEVYIPRKYRRFPSTHHTLPDLPKGVNIIYVDQDFGPATKILPALRKWDGHDVDILVCDDDRLQDRFWIERMATARKERPKDIICERGWQISDRFGISQESPLLPRAVLSHLQGRTPQYRFKRAISLGFYHPNRRVYEKSGYVDVFEGFLGALVPTKSLPREAWLIPDVLWTVDDVWLSGMAKLKNVGVWAHNQPRPVFGNGRWDKVAALTDWQENGFNRESADRKCIEYMRSQHHVWI
jgi:hypothetical protein